MVDAGVAQVRLQAKGQLEQPMPLRLQGSHVRLNALGRRVVLEHQRLASILHGAHLDLTLLQFTHQSLVESTNQEHVSQSLLRRAKDQDT